MPRLRLVSIVCRRAQDFNAIDETYILVNGQQVWGPVQMRGHTTRDLTQQVQPIPFEGTATLEVREQDTPVNQDDSLGAQEVSAELLRAGVKECLFKKGGGDYSVHYEVIS